MLSTGVNLYAVFGSPDDVIHKIMADPSRKLFKEAVFADMSDDATSGDNVVAALKKTGAKCICKVRRRRAERFSRDLVTVQH